MGFLAAMVATAALLRRAPAEGPEAVGMAIYGATLVSLFLASSVYHFFDLGERGNRWLRRLDHAAIFLLIGGTSVPFVVHLLDGTWRVAVLAAIGTCAFAGVLLKLLWIDCPEWLGLSLYFGMGVVAVVPALGMLPRLSEESLVFFGAGVVAYTVGAGIYARRWPDPWPGAFGHHEVWHLFVLAGAGAHYGFAWSLLGAAARPS
jgi:hemolysin III